MGKTLLFAFGLFCCLLNSLSLHAQYKRHIVMLRDKGPSIYTLNKPSEYLTDKAIARRHKQNLSFDSTDLPVSKYYVDSLKRINGVHVIGTSKWLNAVLVRIDEEQVHEQFKAISFIKNATPIASIKRPTTGDTRSRKLEVDISPISRRPILNGIRSTMGTMETFDYGISSGQIKMHNGNFLHEKGFTGEGIIIAMLDAGFANYSTNIAFDSLRNDNRILGGYDFVENENEISTQNSHGSYCLSVIAANRPGKIVGSAPHASFYLVRTENDAEEFPIEEFYWTLGAEYADSSGADIISSSLGYISFEDPVFNHSHADRDGNTTISAIAADLAARKGIIVCNSAGNSGGLSSEEKFIASPGDSDSVLTVGATKPDGTIAAFSSWGPNGAGRIKPDVVSIGQEAVLSDENGEPVKGNGTSFSNPNIAGLVACLWQAFPDMANMDIIEAVKQSSDRYLSPDPQRYGYGIPDFKKAYELLTQLRLSRNLQAILENTWIKVVPNPFNNQVRIALAAGDQTRAIITLYDAKGSLVRKQSLAVNPGVAGLYNVNNLDMLASGVYFLHFEDGTRKATLRIIKQ